MARLGRRWQLVIALLIAPFIGSMSSPALANTADLEVAPFACGGLSAQIVTAPCTPNEGIAGNQLITTSADSPSPHGLAGYVLSAINILTPGGLSDVNSITIPVQATSYDNIFVNVVSFPRMRVSRPITQRRFFHFASLPSTTVSTCTGNYRVANLYLGGESVVLVIVYVVAHKNSSQTCTFGQIGLHTSSSEHVPGELFTKSISCEEIYQYIHE